MTLSIKQKKDILRTAAGFAAVLAVASGLIWLGNRNDAVSEGDRLKSGILTAHQVKAAFEQVGGRLVERPAEEGIQVAAGEVLLELDSTDIDISIESTKAQLRQTEAQMKLTQQGVDLALSQADAAERSLWRRIEAAEASRKSAEAALVRAKADWDRTSGLFPKGAVSRSAYDASTAAWIAAREALSSAERSVDVLAVGATKADRAKLVKTGSAEGMRLDEIVNARQAAENSRTSLEVLAAGRAQLESALKQLEVNRGRLTLHAHENAKVLDVLFEKGEQIAPSTPAVLLETDRLYVDIYVSEAKLGSLREGATVRCHSPALDKDVDGVVRLVDAAPDFADLKMVRERGQADLKLFKVRIDVPRTEGLLTGMTLDVEVQP